MGWKRLLQEEGLDRYQIRKLKPSIQQYSTMTSLSMEESAKDMLRVLEGYNKETQNK